MTGKQLAALFKSPNTQDINPAHPLAEFAKDFYHRLAEASPANATNQRPEFDRRLDAMARLLVGDETMAAAAFDGRQMQIATNRIGHTQDRIKYKVFSNIESDPLTSNQYKIYTGIDLSYNNSAPVRFMHNTYLTYFWTKSSKFEGLKLAHGQEPTIKIELTPLQHMIPFVQNMNVDLSIDLNKTMLMSSDEYNQMKTDLQSNKNVEIPGLLRDISYNALQRRAEHLIEHMTKTCMVMQLPEDHPQRALAIKALEDSQQCLLRDSLNWEAATWYKAKGYQPFPQQYVGSPKEQFDNMVADLHGDFSAYRANHLEMRGQPVMVQSWIAQVVAKMQSGTIRIPDYIKDQIGKVDGIESFLHKAERYFIDVLKLEAFVAQETNQETQFSKWLMQHGGGVLEGAVRAIDTLPDNVHAELRILHDYMTRDKIPSYIATALLCCSHCKLIMDVLNIENVSGTHGRAYPALNLALQDFQQIKPDFLKLILGVELYAKYQILEQVQQKNALEIIQSIAALSDVVLQKIGVQAPRLWSQASPLAKESDDEVEVDDILPSQLPAASAEAQEQSSLESLCNDGNYQVVFAGDGSSAAAGFS